jgi:hypothetical protein
MGRDYEIHTLQQFSVASSHKRGLGCGFGKYFCERGMLCGIFGSMCLHTLFKLKQQLINFQGVLIVEFIFRYP